MDVILTAAITANGRIARHSRELINWSADLELFKQQTMGCPVIMGSNTAATLVSDLKGRQKIIVHRHDNPGNILDSLSAERCFVIGGSRTYGRFGSFLTHLFLTFHPLVISGGIPLFTGLGGTLDLLLEQQVEVDNQKKIYQFQYKVKKQ